MAETPPPDLFDSRYAVSKRTLRVDAFMNQFIKAGGIGIILAVFGIFIFILLEIIPLFQGAHVKLEREIETGVQHPIVLGVDEWSEAPFLLDQEGVLHFADLGEESAPGGDMSQLGPRGLFTQQLDLPEGFAISAWQYHQEGNQILLGSTDGRLVLVTIEYEPDFSDPDHRVIRPTASLDPIDQLGVAGAPVIGLDFYDGPNGRLIAVVQEQGDTRPFNVTAFSRRRSLFGPGKLSPVGEYDLTEKIPGTIDEVLVGGSGNTLLAVNERGQVHYFRLQDKKFPLEQVFEPFGDLKSPGIATANWLLGSTSAVFTSPSGAMRIFSVARDPEAGVLRYQQFHELSDLDGAADLYARSLRNRAFMVAHGDEVSLRYATTASQRWSDTLDFAPTQGVVGSGYGDMFLVGEGGKLLKFDIKDPHPEAGFTAFFGKIWYEGQPEPQYRWESSGAGDEFEPKLSMMPLIFGSLKGTFYAMLFAVPIALLAAFYTSQFLKPRYRRVVKPMMEIMASLPSVVLGFLGALFFAPLLEYRFPSVLMILVLLPTVAFAIGILWGYLPLRFRILIPQGSEFFYYIPILLVVAVIGWYLGPVVENLVFTVKDPATGQMVGDFTQWWPQVTGLEYNQRNSLIVGFMMGFAVIPIVFTISEDAMSSVPPLLKSAALALGASRWQTAFRVILPAASPAIFSSLMIGLGRAVGETMIVVMATGNTAIMDPNIFNGFRALSANIAVELPEAPQESTLYRTLFLGAMVLFIMTFIINTIAEVTRVRLRRRYKSIG
ncbi:MAG: phosphate transport system permease protein [Puniceicoccaceae bacterium 5H]|nr:MAG: phosphate transport system permease protein [Puniceicoccaceae bacterium 5H]